MVKKVLIAILLFFLTFPLTSTSFAQGGSLEDLQFATSYSVVYDVGFDGVTTVTEKIILRNLTSEYFANQFKLTIGATDVFDVKASDEGGILQVSSQKSGNSTTMAVKFNQQVVGIGKLLNWSLQFKSHDFAQKSGKVWEVRIPKVSSVKNLENYNLTVSTPSEFGDPAIISPTPKTQTTSFGKQFLTFDKDQLLSSGVSALFGQNQIFDFELTYHLNNNNLFPTLTSVALPPDTAYQDLIFQRIEPKPLNVTVDDDGNYLAWFKLSRGQKIDVRVLGSAKLYSQSKVKSPFLSQNLRIIYTRPDKYWESNHPKIKSKLAEILGSNPPADATGKAKLIYNFVVGALKYDSQRLKDSSDRLGALTVLDNENSAVCMEFTDLFVALSRTAGIPARELDGYAYTQNTNLRPLSLSRDVLHSWPEFWDDNRGWVMVDPTWENTTGGVDYFNKLDLNHLVFVIHGQSSIRPITAGFYKNAGEISHDVKVNLSENDFLGKANLDVKIDSATPILAGFPNRVKVTVSNLGNAIFASSGFTVSSQKLLLLGDISQNLGPIPAFGTATFNLDLRTRGLFDSYSDTIVVGIGAQKYTKDVIVRPLFIFRTWPMAAAAVVLTMIGLYGLILGGLFYRRRLRKAKKK